MPKVIEVVDTQIFKEKLQVADIVLPLGIIKYKIDPNPKLQQTYQPSKEALEFIN